MNLRVTILQICLQQQVHELALFSLRIKAVLLEGLRYGRD
jgi:hypothetical protein